MGSLSCPPPTLPPSADPNWPTITTPETDSECPDVISLLRSWQLEETNNSNSTSSSSGCDCAHPCSCKDPVPNVTNNTVSLVEKEASSLARILHEMYVYERKQQDLALALIEALGSVKRSLEEELMNGMGVDLGGVQQLLSTARRIGRDGLHDPAPLVAALQGRRRVLENLLLSSVVNPLNGLGSTVSADHLKLINSYAVGKLGGNGIGNYGGNYASLLHRNSSTLLPLLSNKTSSYIPRSSSSPLPRFYFEMEMSGLNLGRIVIETRPDVAPRMCDNFKALVTGERGFGFVGCTVFQCWRGESVITGDFEHNNGRGGHSIYESGLFMPEDTRLPSTRGAIGMRRTQKRHDSKGLVGSQFRVILQDMPGFTGIFGRVVEGIDLIDKISEIGDPSGNPTKRVVIRKCGLLSI